MQPDNVVAKKVNGVGQHGQDLRQFHSMLLRHPSQALFRHVQRVRRRTEPQELSKRGQNFFQLARLGRRHAVKVINHLEAVLESTKNFVTSRSRAV